MCFLYTTIYNLLYIHMYIDIYIRTYVCFADNVFVGHEIPGA